MLWIFLMLLLLFADVMSWFAVCLSLCIWKPQESAKFRGCRMFAVLRYFSFFFWLFVLVIYQVDEEALEISLIVWTVINCLAVLCDARSSVELDYLKNFLQDETAAEYLNRMSLIRPEVSITVRCFHYETVDTSGDEGTMEEEVETFSQTREFSYDSSVHVSSGDPLLGCTEAAVRVAIGYDILLGDKETIDSFKQFAKDMLELFSFHEDTYTHLILKVEIPEVKTRIMGCVGSQPRPFWMRPRFFYIATLLCMTWPYRWLLMVKTNKIHYTMIKHIYKIASQNEESDQVKSVQVKNKRVVSGTYSVDNHASFDVYKLIQN